MKYCNFHLHPPRGKTIKYSLLLSDSQYTFRLKPRRATIAVETLCTTTWLQEVGRLKCGVLKLLQLWSLWNRVFAYKRLAHYIPFNIKLLLVKALAFSHFIYCDSVTNNMTVELSDKLPELLHQVCFHFEVYRPHNSVL